MNKTKKTRLEKSGWKFGSAKDFLGLSDEEAALVEMKLALANALKKRRAARDMTQAEFAKQFGSSQSRVAKMEAADATVSIDLLIRGLLALGATRAEVGRVLGRKASSPAV